MKEAGTIVKLFVVVFRNNVEDLPLLTAACDAFRLLVKNVKDVGMVVRLEAGMQVCKPCYSVVTGPYD